MGRPSSFTPELLDAICERLSNGKALAAVCRENGMPAVRTFLRWADEHESVANEYKRALEARAEWSTVRPATD